MSLKTNLVPSRGQPLPFSSASLTWLWPLWLLNPPGFLCADSLLQLQLLLHLLCSLQLLLLKPPLLFLLPSLPFHFEPSHLGSLCSQPVLGSFLLFPLSKEGLRNQSVLSARDSVVITGGACPSNKPSSTLHNVVSIQRWNH